MVQRHVIRSRYPRRICPYWLNPHGATPFNPCKHLISIYAHMVNVQSYIFLDTIWAKFYLLLCPHGTTFFRTTSPMALLLFSTIHMVYRPTFIYILDTICTIFYYFFLSTWCTVTWFQHVTHMVFAH